MVCRDGGGAGGPNAYKVGHRRGRRCGSRRLVFGPGRPTSEKDGDSPRSFRGREPRRCCANVPRLASFRQDRGRTRGPRGQLPLRRVWVVSASAVPHSARDNARHLLLLRARCDTVPRPARPDRAPNTSRLQPDIRRGRRASAPTDCPARSRSSSHVSRPATLRKRAGAMVASCRASIDAALSYSCLPHGFVSPARILRGDRGARARTIVGRAR
jgi:hypothetical protein